MKQTPQIHLRNLTALQKKGFVGWLLNRLHPVSRPEPQLAVLERVPLAPRQSLVLVEAEGKKLLIATSPDCAPAFYRLDAPDSGNWSMHARDNAVDFRGRVC